MHFLVGLAINPEGASGGSEGRAVAQHWDGGAPEGEREEGERGHGGGLGCAATLVARGVGSLIERWRESCCDWRQRHRGGGLSYRVHLSPSSSTAADGWEEPTGSSDAGLTGC